MQDAKVANVPLGSHFKLSSDQCPGTEAEKEDMMNVSYSHAIGSVMYMMVCTRPDLAHAISVLSRYMSNPGREHWEAVKWLMKYLKGSTNVGLLFEHCPNGVILEGFVDSDFAGDKDKRRSTSAYMFTSCGNCIS